MGLVVATTVGAIIWVALWAIGVKALDAFFILMAVVLLTVVVRSLAPHLPGRREG